MPRIQVSDLISNIEKSFSQKLDDEQRQKETNILKDVNNQLTSLAADFDQLVEMHQQMLQQLDTNSKEVSDRVQESFTTIQFQDITQQQIESVVKGLSLFQQYLLDSNHIDKEFWVSPPDHLSYFNKNGLIKLANAVGWRVNKVISDFPIDLDLLNPNSNYIKNSLVGKASHRKRVEFENFIHSMSIEKTNQFYESLLNLGLGRNITGFFSKCKSREVL